MSVLDTKPFTQSDYDFLQEYAKVMKPLATSIDNLQSSNQYYALLLPTLHSSKGDLECIGAESLIYCSPLLTAIGKGFALRFARFFDIEDEQCQFATIATCVHPFFKTWWIHPEYAEKYSDKIQDIVVKAAIESACHHPRKQTNPIGNNCKDENNSEFLLYI